MNVVQNNYLYISEDDHTNEMIRFCMDYVKAGKFVLLIQFQDEVTLATIFKSLAEEIGVSKDALKRFIVITCYNFTALVERLQQWHGWKYVPAVIVLDLRKFIQLYRPQQECLNDSNESSEESSRTFLMMDLSFCVATFYNYLRSLKNVLKTLACHSEENPTKEPIALVMMRQNESCEFAAKQVELFVNLYFYNNKAFSNFAELLTHIRSST